MKCKRLLLSNNKKYSKRERRRLLDLNQNNMLRIVLFVAVATLLLGVSSLIVDGCNEAVCASVVSKCMLTQSCKCDLKNCSCCKECYSCLGERFDDCCSCVDMCTKSNSTGSPLTKISHVEEFSDPIPSLFESLTMDPDPEGRWTSYTYPQELDVSLFAPKLDNEIIMANANGKSSLAVVNCTVTYMAHCSPWNKCKESCRSMGASSYRWFHDGCCECVGQTCINYGINESRCTECHLSQDDEEEDDVLQNDYGDGSVADAEQELKL